MNAVLSHNSHKTRLSLLGMVALKNVPYVRIEGSSAIKLSQKLKTIKFEFIDHLGSPFSGLKSKNVKVTLQKVSDLLSSESDITS